MVTLLDMPIITACGVYSYSLISLQGAKQIIKENGARSAIGHEPTARIVSTLLGMECPVNRTMYRQSAEETVIVFKFNGRPKKGEVLTIEKIEEIGYTWGVLHRIA